MIDVIIADDHLEMRRALRGLLTQADDVRVVGEAANGMEAIQLTKQLNPDVIVMDVIMPGMDGLQATEELQLLDTAARVLMVSIHNEVGLMTLALEKGASGYLPKHHYEELLPAIRAIHNGQVYLP